MLLSFNLLAATGNFSYIAPTEREDNTLITISEISTFKVYDNGVERTDFDTYPLPNNSTGFSMFLDFGEHNVNLTTVDTDGRESAYSETITFRIHTNPKPPSGLTVNITQ
jgi:hypothetical protein